MPLSHDLEKAPLRARSAPERNRYFRPPTCTELDVRPPIGVLCVEMKEGDALDVKDPAGALRNARKLTEFAKDVLEIEKVFRAGMSHKCLAAALEQCAKMATREWVRAAQKV